MNTPRLIYGAIRERHEDGSHTDEPGGAPEWFIEVDGKIYRLATALSCPAVPAEWIKQVSEISDMEKSLDYYRSGMMQRCAEARRPKYVPSRVRLTQRVTGDWPIGHGTQSGPGEYDCDSNQYGAVSIRAEDGKMLGLRPNEFEPIAWAANPHLEVKS